jgi:uncharacterized protein involved in exopolysaccharide biosynthesis
MEQVGLEPRLERVEDELGQLDAALARRRTQRSQRIAVLRHQLRILRDDSATDVTRRVARRQDRLGVTLIYAGCLVLVWLVLWQIALAFGLR